MVDKATHARIPMHACKIIIQETSSKKIIVEANRALRSLKKERGPNDLRRGCKGQNVIRIWTKTTNMGP